MTVKEIELILKGDGWILKTIKGSHAQFIHPFKLGKVTVPLHKGDVPISTAKSIFKQAKIEVIRL